MNRGTTRRAGISSAIVSAILAAVLSISLSGCSALFIHEPPKGGEAGSGPECSSSLWPMVDVAWGMAYTLYAIVTLVVAANGNLCGEGNEGGGNWDDCNVNGFFLSVPLFAMAAAHGYSAGVGFGRNSRCTESRQAAVETVKIGSGEDRYKAPEIKSPKIILEKKKPEAVEKVHAQEAEDLTVPMKFDLPMMEERKARMKSLEEQLLEDEIKQLKDVMEIPTGGPQKADLLFRLAERYYERSRRSHEKEREKYEADLKKWEEEKKKDPNTPEPAMKKRGSKVWAKATFDIYRVILRNYKDYNRRDEVLFVFAYSLLDSGEKQEGVERYRQLIKEHPSSIYVSDAYLALGEHFFDAEEYVKAIEEYEEAAKYRGIRTSFLAIYKLAWCHLKLGDKAKAREFMKRVASEAKSKKLRGRANRELVMIFAE